MPAEAATIAPMRSFLAGAAVALLMVLSASAAEKAPELLYYAKQPSINAALKQLTEAQKKAGSDKVGDQISGKRGDGHR